MMTFQAASKTALTRVTTLDDNGLRRAADILGDAQAELIRKLANAPTDYGAWFYNQLLQDVQRLANDMAQELQNRLNADLNAVLHTVEDVITTEVTAEAARAGVSLILPAISRQAIETLAGYTPGDKIKGVADGLKQAVSTEIQRAVLGVTSPWNLQKFLAANLDAAGPFGSAFARAEAIWRTESLRFFNSAAQARYEALERTLPGEFLKVWRHTNVSHPRPHHQALDGVAIGVNEYFQVGKYSALYPHDPDLPVGEIVNCGCSHYMHRVR
jgi:hypothetical protein